ncbi:MAG: arginine repressor [Pseudomonadota bacterium]
MARASGARSGGASRRNAIRELLARHAVTSQDELQRHLAARGITAAQATVSRDLVLLGVTRVATPDGHRYHIPDDDGALPIDLVRGLVEAVVTNGVLVVVRTKAGAASTIARAIDDARVADALGTIAGDDTIFVAPARPRGAAALARQLRRLLGA